MIVGFCYKPYYMLTLLVLYNELKDVQLIDPRILVFVSLCLLLVLVFVDF